MTIFSKDSFYVVVAISDDNDMSFVTLTTNGYKLTKILIEASKFTVLENAMLAAKKEKHFQVFNVDMECRTQAHEQFTYRETWSWRPIE